MAKKKVVELNPQVAEEVAEEVSQGAVDVEALDAAVEVVAEEGAEVSADAGATLVEPELVPVTVWATDKAFQGRLYHPYFKVYIWAHESSMLPYLDSWAMCQRDAGLLRVE